MEEEFQSDGILWPQYKPLSTNYEWSTESEKPKRKKLEQAIFMFCETYTFSSTMLLNISGLFRNNDASSASVVFILSSSPESASFPFLHSLFVFFDCKALAAPSLTVNKFFRIAFCSSCLDFSSGRNFDFSSSALLKLSCADKSGDGVWSCEHGKNLALLVHTEC